MKRYTILLSVQDSIALSADSHHYADGRVVFGLAGETVALFRLDAIIGFVVEGQPCLQPPSSGAAPEKA